MGNGRPGLGIGIADFPRHWDIQARFADLDPNSHVNNIAIAQMFSEGRSAFIRHMFSHVERPSGLHFVVGQAAVRYIGEAQWPNIFTIGTGILDIGTKSMRLGQAFFMEGACCALAEAVLVARQDGASMAFDAAMQAYLGEQRLHPELVPRQLL